MKFRTDDTIAIVVDYQERLIPAMKDKEEFVNNSKILIDGLNKLNIPLIISQQYTKGLGETISDISSVIGDNQVYDKITFSCMGNSEMKNAVKCFDTKNIIVCGCEAHICVLQTVIDLIEMGYNVALVSDCITSRKEKDENMAILRAQQEGALITTYEAILFELCDMAGNDTFKYISKLIK